MSFLSLLCAILAFALFGLATDDHHAWRFGQRPPPRKQRRMRALAWCALAAAFPPAVAANGWVSGPILWSGVVMLGAGLVFLALNFVRGHSASK